MNPLSVEYGKIKEFGCVPISNAELRSLLSDYQNVNDKISQWCKSGILLRMKQGMYLVSSKISGVPYSLELVANHLYGPSYISLQYALRHYGMIPESVPTVTSVTLKHTRSFNNELGTFTYRRTHPRYFAVGITGENVSGVRFLIASPEKALCDTLLYMHYLEGNTLETLEQTLREDLRVDTNMLTHLNPNIVQSCIENSDLIPSGKKIKMLYNLQKLIVR